MAQQSDTMTPMEVQHAAIDQALKDIRSHKRYVRQTLSLRAQSNETPPNAETYMCGLHDGLALGQNAVDGITKHQDYDRQFDVRRVPDESLAEKLKVVTSEAGNENWGNVAVNLETAAEAARELQDADTDGAEESDA